MWAALKPPQKRPTPAHHTQTCATGPSFDPPHQREEAKNSLGLVVPPRVCAPRRLSDLTVNALSPQTPRAAVGSPAAAA